MKLILLLFYYIVFDMYIIPSTNISDAVLREIAKYPKLEIQDLYKLAYQAAMGNEHIMSDTVQSLKYLEEEFAAIDSSSNEPLIVYIRSDSAIARINLRAFKAQGLSNAKLFSLMIKTATTFIPSISMLKHFLSNIEKLAEDEKIPFKKDELRKYFNDMEQKNFPPVHHSKSVIENYKPAYRIVAGKDLSLQ